MYAPAAMTKSNWSPAIGECVNTPAGQATVTEIYYDGDLGLVWSDHPEDVYSLPVSDVTPKRRRSPSPVTTSKKRQRGGTTYTKQMTTSKEDQNAMFVEYLQTLGRDMRQLRVMVLDTRACHSIRALVGAGVQPSRIYVPQPDADEAAAIKRQFPTVRAYSGRKMGDLIWELAGSKTQFDGILGDYCGMPGSVGKKNTPMDDVSNLFRYDMLAETAVVTQTICARSRTTSATKFSGLRMLKNHLSKKIRQNNRRMRRTKTYTYTDPGSQTMCHLRCIVGTSR